MKNKKLENSQIMGLLTLIILIFATLFTKQYSLLIYIVITHIIISIATTSILIYTSIKMLNNKEAFEKLIKEQILEDESKKILEKNDEQI